MNQKTNTAIKRNVKPTPSLPKNALPSKRLFAFFLDLSLLAAVTYASAIKFNLQQFIPELGRWMQYLVFAFWYYLILTIIPNSVFSQSLGKLVFGIKVLTVKYKRLDFGKCFVRDLFLRPLILVAPWTILNKKSIGLHDKLADTIVVEAR